MRIKTTRILTYMLFGGLCLFVVGCQNTTSNPQKAISKTSIFSWEEEYLYPQQEDVLKQTMDALDCEAIYQEIPSEIDEAVLQDYLHRRSVQEQDVYALAGQAEWGIEPTGESMLQRVKQVTAWNAKMDEGSGFRGIVFDVEPYALDAWKQDPQAVMKQFVDNSVKAYELAKESDLIIILCIPNFYDRINLSNELDRLVEFGSDGIAIMNYNKDDEVGQISDEVAIAKKHQKGIINVTEMQKPGFHDLTNQNTYYYDGVEAVKESWNVIKLNVDYAYLGFSWHYLKPIEQLLEGVK